MKKLALATVAVISAVTVSAFTQNRNQAKSMSENIAQKANTRNYNEKLTVFAGPLSGEKANLAQADYSNN